ncbi:MOSC domain-containing protein [Nocardioides sp. Arc9.136]|uniref:MOSC domain-containing protein n=1 Tax=Nocardioides sp. Arc9.136 TaxID=2996826 RepID=UPI0026651502|nr:MOSC domain-containing protein [Nocardioides sp. Arc9.136]WKN50111.1 MOSC domain-containing protein [Nocardioides sp. Arc9.136]
MSPGSTAGARVVALHVAPERHAPMEARASIEVVAGRGVVGDRWWGTKHRHVSVQSAEALAEAAAELGRPVPPAATRRTVTIAGGAVPTEPGARLQVGDVLLEVVRVAAPCRVMESSMGPGGATALRRRGGSILRALTSGTVRLGDEVSVVPTA